MYYGIATLVIYKYNYIIYLRGLGNGSLVAVSPLGDNAADVNGFIPGCDRLGEPNVLVGGGTCVSIEALVK